MSALHSKQINMVDIFYKTFIYWKPETLQKMKITYNEWKEDEILKLFENQQKIVTKEPGKIKESANYK